jgi:predicted translin family RNA/ssDNA-binding protein
MIDKKFWKKVNDDQFEYDKSRRIIIGQSNKALHAAKQAIFALHRDKIAEAEEKIEESKSILLNLERDFGKRGALLFEGAWNASREEFVEANLFLMFIKGDKVGKISDLKIRNEEYLGGLSDYTGELMRRAILLSSKRKFKEVNIIADEISDVIDQMLAYNLTGLLRTKFDQAKKNLNKIEQILYEISLKN